MGSDSPALGRQAHGHDGGGNRGALRGNSRLRPQQRFRGVSLGLGLFLREKPWPLLLQQGRRRGSPQPGYAYRPPRSPGLQSCPRCFEQGVSAQGERRCV